MHSSCFSFSTASNWLSSNEHICVHVLAEFAILPQASEPWKAKGANPWTTKTHHSSVQGDTSNKEQRCEHLTLSAFTPQKKHKEAASFCPAMVSVGSAFFGQPLLRPLYLCQARHLQLLTRSSQRCGGESLNGNSRIALPPWNPTGGSWKTVLPLKGTSCQVRGRGRISRTSICRGEEEDLPESIKGMLVSCPRPII